MSASAIFPHAPRGSYIDGLRFVESKKPGVFVVTDGEYELLIIRDRNGQLEIHDHMPRSFHKRILNGTVVMNSDHPDC